MSHKNKDYDVHILVSVPLGTYSSRNIRKVVEKVFKTKKFHEASSNTLFDTAKILIIEKISARKKIYNINLKKGSRQEAKDPGF